MYQDLKVKKNFDEHDFNAKQNQGKQFFQRDGVLQSRNLEKRLSLSHQQF
jgi:translation initiation factor IF-3